ncbi:MAG TPA: peptide ligase PGM1-related protein [Actinomycetota bacterium]|nr:peptide ligase PGM1-related protein [Actinomycetota bacterium]
MADPATVERFRELQRKFSDLWPTLTVRAQPIPRTVVIVHSINLELPPHLLPVVSAYEERYLALVLLLLRQPAGRVIHVTSQPLLPQLAQYYFGLMPKLIRPSSWDRFVPVSVSDGGPGPLTQKLLDRPLTIERIRSHIPDPDWAYIVPFSVGPRERELAVRLGIPIYGTDPDLSWMGTKSGSRRMFAEAGVPHPAGVEDVHSIGDVVEAIAQIRSRKPDVAAVMVKVNEAAGGIGNGVLDLRGADDRAVVEKRVRAVALDDPDGSRDAFFDQLARTGGIVEERLAGEEVTSPSVQIRIAPDGVAEVLSTHDQILGGATGQMFLGARFPADPGYAAEIARHALAIASRLADAGALGRFGIDFVCTRNGGGMWDVNAIEINLRNGGTTHPFLTLSALCDGTYDAETGTFTGSDGRRKFYVASDHLESEAYKRLTPDDVLDTIEERDLGWDVERCTGYAFHLISAVAVAGRLGLTAIADSPAEAQQMSQRAEATFDEISAASQPAR